MALVGPTSSIFLVTLGLLLLRCRYAGFLWASSLAVALCDGLAMLAFGVSNLLAGLTVLYRDFCLFVLFVLGLYATPIIYPPTMLPKAPIG